MSAAARQAARDAVADAGSLVGHGSESAVPPMPALDTAAAALPSQQAALLLHGVSAADRAWLLDRLDPPMRETLRPLLTEVASLGLAAQPTTLDAWCTPFAAAATSALSPAVPQPSVEATGTVGLPEPAEPAAASPSSTAAESPPAARSPIAAWPAAWRLVGALRGEPDAIVLAVLRAQPRGWRQILVCTWPAQRRASLRAGLRATATPLAPGLERALKAALEA